MDRPLRCLVRRRGPGTLRVLQAADGVANKEVDDAWVTAQGAEKTARFASAETIRWLEWGARSYHDYALGLALLLFAAALVRTDGRCARLPTWWGSPGSPACCRAGWSAPRGSRERTRSSSWWPGPSALRG